MAVRESHRLQSRILPCQAPDPGLGKTQNSRCFEMLLSMSAPRRGQVPPGFRAGRPPVAQRWGHGHFEASLVQPSVRPGRTPFRKAGGGIKQDSAALASFQHIVPM